MVCHGLEIDVSIQKCMIIIAIVIVIRSVFKKNISNNDNVYAYLVLFTPVRAATNTPDNNWVNRER